MGPGDTSGRTGYSGTPLAKKLGIKEGQALVLVSAPAGWEVPDVPEGIRLMRARADAKRITDADIVIAFFERASRLMHDGPLLAGRLAPRSSLWAAWPRRAGGHESDITENLLREVLLPVGVVDVKVAALDDHWSGLKFVWRKSTTRPGSARR